MIKCSVFWKQFVLIIHFSIFGVKFPNKPKVLGFCFFCCKGAQAVIISSVIQFHSVPRWPLSQPQWNRQISLYYKKKNCEVFPTHLLNFFFFLNHSVVIWENGAPGPLPQRPQLAAGMTLVACPEHSQSSDGLGIRSRVSLQRHQQNIHHWQSNCSTGAE